MKLFLTVSALLLTTLLSAQIWFENNNFERSDKGYSFDEYQQMFDNYWSDKDVENGYYFENGEKKKAFGWKQFKRWEHFWESRVNADGSFPNQKQYKAALDSYRNSERGIAGDWTSLGPYESKGGYAGVGRINQIAFHPTDKNTFWATSPLGGMWATYDGGETWTVLTDQNEVISTTAIAVPSDYDQSQTIYLGTGDMDSWQHENGIGVLKSTDGGQSWQKTGLSFDISWGHTVNQFLIHPENNNIIYAATSDGIYLTYDAAETWDLIFDTNEICDIEFKPNDPSVIYAANKERGRIYKLWDNGASFKTVYDQYDNGARRIQLAVTAANPEIVYAIASNEDNGLLAILKSTNSGESYLPIFIPGSETNNPNLLTWSYDGSGEGGQGWYDLTLAVHPENEFILYCGGVNTWKSIDGGLSWSINNVWRYYNDCSDCAVVHADKHFHAFNKDVIFECNDGGLYKSEDGDNWENVSNGIVNSQIYRLGVSQTERYDVSMGLQDNGSKNYQNGIWSDVNGGDGMECLIDYTDANIQYAETQNGGSLRRTLNHWQSKSNIKPEDASGAWVTPYIIDPKDPAILYGGYQHIYKSYDRGDNWEILFQLGSSPKFRFMDMSEGNTDYIYASEPTRIWKTVDAGKNWIDITEGLPIGVPITSIEVHNIDPDMLWVTLGAYNEHGVYVSADGGLSWENLSEGLPPIPVNSIVHNKQNTYLTELYAGTDFGIYYKLGEDEWKPFNNGLPKVVIGEMEMYYDTIPSLSLLRAGTYGRGLWESKPYSGDALPIANFGADNTEILLGQTVNYSDSSSYNPYYWEWEFEGGEPGFSNKKNPSVSYNQTGEFKVSLSIYNGAGRDTVIKEQFIRVDCHEELNYLAEKAKTLITAYESIDSVGQPIITSNLDNANSEAIDIGFPFYYNCEEFDHFILNTNGFIKLGTELPSDSALYYSEVGGIEGGVFASLNEQDNNIISAFNHDLEATDEYSFMVHTSGEAPNRICTIQFSGLKDKSTEGNSTFENIKFQIKLFEGSNLIEFVYGDWLMMNSGEIKSAACGIKGSGNEERQVISIAKGNNNSWNEASFSNSKVAGEDDAFYFGGGQFGNPESGQTFRFTPIFFRDLSLENIYAFYEVPAEFGNPEHIQALVKNNGYNDLHDIDLELQIEGANSFNIYGRLNEIESGGTEIVTFDGFQASKYGENSLSIQTPDDDFSADNSMIIDQHTTLNSYNYANTQIGSDEGLGFNNGKFGTFASRYPINGMAQIKSVDVFIHDRNENLGQSIQAVVINSAGESIGTSEKIVLDSTHLNNWNKLEIIDTLMVFNEDFYAGIQVFPLDSSIEVNPIGLQIENPVHPSAFYVYEHDSVLSEISDDFGHRFMIGASVSILEWKGGFASANDTILCYGEKGRVTVSEKTGKMQWEVSDSGVGAWRNVEGGFGSNNKTYLTDNLFSDQYFRARFTLDNDLFAYSNIAYINVLQEDETQDSLIICAGESYVFPDGNLVDDIQHSFEYVSILENSNACDSIIRTQVEVLPSFYESSFDTICKWDSYIFPDGQQIDAIQFDTTYFISFPLTNGCDSTYAYQLEVIEVNTAIIETDTTLFAFEENATYQWIDCNTGAAIEGMTNKAFTPDNSGFFAVIIDDGICVDTSECIAFIHLSDDDLLIDGITIYPNPTDNLLTITSENAVIEAVKVFDISGKLLMEKRNMDNELIKMELELASLSKGILLVEIMTSRGIETHRILLE